MSIRSQRDAGLEPWPISPTALLWLLAVFALVWFGVLNLRHLVPSDEGRYAEMAREMLATGDWVTPRYNGYLYFEKPPLQTWMNALTFMIFGLGDWQARLWTALTGFGGVLLVGYTGRRIFGARAGLFAALTLASAPLWALLGHFNVLDMGLSFMMALVLCSLLLAQRPGLTDTQTRNWMWLCWLAMGLSILSKGLIGVVLPGAVLVIYTLISRDWALWKRLHIASGLIVMLAVTVPWFAAVMARNPSFFDFFFINEHFNRFLKPDHHRPGALWYFVPVLIVGFLPWLSMIPRTISASRAVPRQANGFRPVLMITVWTVFIFCFFSISHSKLISYVLPIAPSIALLFGLGLAGMSRESLRKHLIVSAVLFVATIVTCLVFLSHHSDSRNPVEAYRQFSYYLYAASFVGLIGLGVARWLSSRSAKQALIAFAGTWLAFTMIGGTGHEAFGRGSSGIDLVPAVRAEMERLGPDTPFYSVGTLDHTMPYYLRHTMIMVAVQDELEFGISQAPDSWIPTLNKFADVWMSAPKALALVDPEKFTVLETLGLPMKVIARDNRRVIIEKPMPADAPAPGVAPAAN